MPQILLPPKYYVDHFRDFLETVESFQLGPHTFIQEFGALSEDAQSVYVRMVNRKRRFFTVSSLQYKEITDPHAGVSELTHKGFARRPSLLDLPQILPELAKEKLQHLLSQSGKTAMKSWSKPRLVEEAVKAGVTLEHLEPMLVQERMDELSFLFFLYFGRLENDLSLYTLRDLGVLGHQVPKVSCRFRSLPEARSEFFFRKLQRSGEIQSPEDIQSWPFPLTESAREIREERLLSYADHHRKEPELALSYLEDVHLHPAREKKARLLFEAGRKDECLSLLELLLEQPSSDEECLFAQDFLARKFEKKKTTLLTDVLVASKKLDVDEAYFRRPEEGVQHEFHQRGARSHFTENFLWNSFFGMLFWHELFEESPRHSQFDWLPDMKVFYHMFEDSVHVKLALLQNRESLLSYLRLLAEEKNDIPNGIFTWHPDLLGPLEDLISHSSPEQMHSVLLFMAKNYPERRTGFPDLMVIENGELSFYEIKAEGDVLKQHQLKMILALKDAGYRVDLLRVFYRYNPQQTYVVVDLETTGQVSPWHRITEIGAVKVRGGEIIDTFETLVNPRRSISKEIQELTGITNDMVKTAPEFSEVAEKFQEFSRDAIFVAHNVQFDYGFLQQEFERLEQSFVRPFVCTKAGMKKHYPGLPSYSLASLTKEFQIPLETHHRALCDAKAAAGLLKLINDKRATSG